MEEFNSVSNHVGKNSPVIFLQDNLGSGGDGQIIRMLAEECARRYGGTIVTQSELLRLSPHGNMAKAFHKYCTDGKAPPRFVFGSFNAEIEKHICDHGGIICRGMAEDITKIITGNYDIIPHNLTAEDLQKEASRFSRYFPSLKQPIIAIQAVLALSECVTSDGWLYGEPTSWIQTISDNSIRDFNTALVNAISRQPDLSGGATLFLCSSPRTDKQTLSYVISDLKFRLENAGLNHVDFIGYDFHSKTITDYKTGLSEASDLNPYKGLLTSASRHIIIGESLSTLSEIVSTGRPVTLFEGNSFSRSHQDYVTRWQPGVDVFSDRPYTATFKRDEMFDILFSTYEENGRVLVVPPEREGPWQNDYGFQVRGSPAVHIPKLCP